MQTIKTDKTAAQEKDKEIRGCGDGMKEKPTILNIKIL